MSIGKGSTKSRRGLGRLGLGVVAVCALQVGLIFALSDRSPRPPRPPGPATVIRLNDRHVNEWLALGDPTLFALSHPRGFSGAARLREMPTAFRPSDWVAPEFWLPMPVQGLVEDFRQFSETSRPPRFQAVVELPVVLTMPDVPPTTPLATRSELRVDGGLKSRLILPINLSLPAWPSGELLSNSVVEVRVDARGQVFSPLLISGSGVSQADQFAMDAARRLRFAPAESGGGRSGWTSGTLTFEWATTPLLQTNGVVPSP